MVDSIFVYNLRKRFFQNMRFLQNHKDNYGASCKPENNTSMEQFFANSKSSALKDITGFFSNTRFFLGSITFLSLRNQTFVWNLIKIRSAVLLFSNSLRLNENNLIYFLKQLGNKGKRKFSASRAVFSCNVLRGNTVKTFLS